MRNLFAPLALAACLSSLLLSIQPVLAQNTAFTYQGRLNSGTNAATGSYDLSFAVYDANVAGNLIAGPITNSAVAVSNGLFTVTLNFGAGVFTGTNYWVQMAVTPAGAGTFSTLVPRQQLTPTPSALSLSLASPQVNALCPPGSVMAYMGTTAPPGWLLCDNSQVSRTNYAALFAVIGTASGPGDGSTTFNLPDMRGIFLRGVNGSRNDAYADPGDNYPNSGRGSINTGGNAGNAVGSYQLDQYTAHTHSLQRINPSGGGSGYYSIQTAAVGNTLESSGDMLAMGAAGGTETRPKNVYVNYIIKY